MKYIIAIIQPYRLADVQAELYKEDVNLMTVSEVVGHGRQKGVTEIYRSYRESGNLLRKIRIEIAVNDDFVDRAVKAIMRGARSGESGEIGDGKIFVLPLERVYRIRTGETGGIAIG